jgi:hypothetical protein
VRLGTDKGAAVGMASRDRLSKLASCLSGDGLPGRCIAAAAAAATAAGVVDDPTLPGGEIAEEGGGGDIVVL